MILIHSFLDLIPIMPDKSLNWPGSSVSKGANSMSLDLFGQFPQHIDFSVISITDLHSLKNVLEPTSTLATGSALTTTLVLVEL